MLFFLRMCDSWTLLKARVRILPRLIHDVTFKYFHEEYLRTQIGFPSSQCPVPLQCLIDGPCNLYPFFSVCRSRKRGEERKKEIEKSMFEAAVEMEIYCCLSFHSLSFFLYDGGCSLLFVAMRLCQKNFFNKLSFLQYQNIFINSKKDEQIWNEKPTMWVRERRKAISHKFYQPLSHEIEHFVR